MGLALDLKYNSTDKQQAKLHFKIIFVMINISFILVYQRLQDGKYILDEGGPSESRRFWYLEADVHS